MIEHDGEGCGDELAEARDEPADTLIQGESNAFLVMWKTEDSQQLVILITIMFRMMN